MRRSLVSDALLFHGTAQHVSLLARRPLVFSTVAQIKKVSRISHHARCVVAATKLPAPFGGAPAQEKNGFRSGVVFVQDSRSYLNQLLWARCIDPNIARCARSLAPGAQLSVGFCHHRQGDIAATGRHKWQATKGRNGDRTVRTGVQSNGCIVGGGSAR